MIRLGVTQASADDVMPIEVEWEVPSGDSVASVAVTSDTVGALLGTTTTPVRPVPITSNSVTMWWSKAPDSVGEIVNFTLTATTTQGRVAHRQVRLVAK